MITASNLLIKGMTLNTNINQGQVRANDDLPQASQSGTEAAQERK